MTLVLIQPSFESYAEALRVEGDLALPYSNAYSKELSPYQILRNMRPRAELREKGTFFTSSDFATRLWTRALGTVKDGDIIVDPACGAGDLLMPVIEYARNVGIRGLVIRGVDIDPAFTRVSAVRLAAETVGLSGRVQISTGDFLEDCSSIADATHVVMNPPFVPVKVATDWANGSVNAAALFVVTALETMRPGARFLAVLPDVLRSGSRYEKWRRRVEELALLASVEVLGLFDSKTDIDVFVLDSIVSATGTHARWVEPAGVGCTIETFFDVRVGPVVPHRDPEVGPEMDFVTARSLSARQHLRRKFSGRQETGPLVFVNRTSRPGENPRVKARLRSSSGAVAVENHLLVLVPRDGLVASCRGLLNVLSDQRTVDYLDDRIRCRHLTVQAVKGIPWREKLDL